MSMPGHFARQAVAMAHRAAAAATGLGVLRVQTVTAGGTFPVENAAVAVSDLQGTPKAQHRTDRSGLTARTVLDCNPAALTLVQSTAKDSVVRYRVEISHPRYRPMAVEVEIFDGVETVLVADLLPAEEEIF